MITTTDSILWYNVGVFGEAGFAVPNWSDDTGTLNNNIYDLCNLIGRNLFAIMRTEDADMTVPPSLNTVRKVHKLYVRAAQILHARAVPSNEENFEGIHVSPSRDVFKVYPVPYFKVRSPFLKRWCQLALELLTEMMQHTENHKSNEISVEFSNLLKAYLGRIYQNMAAELFGKTREVVRNPNFLLEESDFTSYNPAQYFTSTELIDPVSPHVYVFTEDQLARLSEGIPVTALPLLQPYPGTGKGDLGSGTGGTNAGTTNTPQSSVFPVNNV